MGDARCLVLAACLAALLAGCASYRPEPVSPAANARALDSRRLDDPRLQKFIALELGHHDSADPPPGWGLTRLTLAAIYYHPDLALAHARLAAAEAAVVTAGERPNPILRFAAAFGTAAAAGAIPVGAAPVTIGPVVDFVVDTFGKRAYRTAQARHLADAARWDLATAGWQVRGRVRTALLDLWAARQRLLLTGQRRDLQRQLVELLEHRLAVGEASSLDVSRERIALAQISLALRDLEQAAAEARVRLATAVGIPVQALHDVAVSVDAFEAPPPATARLAIGALRHAALTGRSDVQAALQQYEAAQSALQLQLASQYPDLTLGPGYEYDFGVNKYILDLGAELPVFHHNQGPIAEAAARRQQAAARFTAVQAQIIGAIDAAATAYRQATASVATGDALLADERRRAGQVERSFRAGEVGRPSLIATRLEVAATAVSRVAAVVQQRQALGRLEDALQHPLYEPSARFSISPTGPRPPSDRSS